MKSSGLFQSAGLQVMQLMLDSHAARGQVLLLRLPSERRSSEMTSTNS